MPFADVLFPRRCLGCGEHGAYFCADCLNKIFLKDERICPMCGRPAIGGLTHPGCQRPWGLDGLTSIFANEGVFKKAIKKLKYKFVTDLASDLVELFLSFCGEDKGFARFCQTAPVIFVPIPLHDRRQRWRGFNQAELLGQMIAQNLGIGFAPDLIVRQRPTKPQVGLDKNSRRRNIRFAFKKNPNSKFITINYNFLLFDDVWTSGATLHEAGKILKRNGAAKVWGLTLAR
jgi:ComF family protein